MASDSGSPFRRNGVFGKDSQGGGGADVYLNLTPLMDVMSNILFFLLAAFGASIIAVIPASVPVVSSGDTSVETAADKVTVALRIDATGFSVQAESQTIPPEELKLFQATIPKTSTGYDYEGLRAALLRIKQKWPGSASMVLVADDDLRYEGLAKVMDAARDTHLASGQMVTLFPDVVLSSIARGERGR